MKSKLRILHLEDDLKDAELIKSTLVRDGIICDIVRVETREDFTHALEECGFDVVFLDYTIPRFDGLSALAIAKEKCPDTPVIFVSGTMGEEKAIETLKRGATDYVLKNNLSRLVPTINRALREAEERVERKRVEEALLKEKSFTDLAINSLPGVFYIFDDNGRFLRWNRNLEIISGYSDEEISKMNPLDFFSGEEKKLAEDAIREVFIKGESKVEANLISKDGGKRPYFFTGIRFVSDNQNCLIGMGIDITERKKTEEKINHLLDIITRAKEEWELTFDNVTEIILLIGRDLRILRCNKSFSEFAGISINEIIGKKCYDFIPCDQKQIGYCRVSLQTGERLRKTEFQTKTGRWFYESHCPIIDENGKFYFSVIVATDITDLKNTHQSLIEYQEELRNRVRELEDFYEMGVGRELKMIELKEEVESMKEELAKYKKDA